MRDEVEDADDIVLRMMMLRRMRMRAIMRKMKWMC